MERWQNRVALVTGASMGVGEAVVRTLVKQGMKVVGCARSVDKLKAIEEDLKNEKGQVMTLECDLAKEEDIKVMFQKIKDKWGGVDVCVNNAGVTLNSNVLDGDPAQWEYMWKVNVHAACLCSRESYLSMKDRSIDDGQIININSLSGHRVGSMHFYSVTKFALNAVTDAIRWQLRNIDSHIRVAEISPGLINSTFHGNYYQDEEPLNRIRQRQALQPEDIASQVVNILSCPPHVQIHDILMRPTEQKP